MPIHRTSLRMAHDATWPQRRKWSTTFFLEAANPAMAAAAIAGIWQADLRVAAYEHVFAYEVYATDLDPTSESFSTVPIPPSFQRGSMVVGASEKYLAKTAVRVPLTVPNSRSSFKFWRPGLREGDVLDGATLADLIRENIADAFTSMITDLDGALVDPDGQLLTGVGNLRLTTREFGRLAGTDLPEPPPVG